jgi:hypothetical protein
MRHIQGFDTSWYRYLSGWQDSNLRPPHPKCGAIPGYATSRSRLGLQK